mgnify:CR=1 FL=1
MKTRLESTKAINQLKVRAIKNGGYAKHMTKIIAACTAHKAAFGIDLTPNQF